MQQIICTSSSIIPSATKTTETETESIEGTAMIIFDLVKEQHEWRYWWRNHILTKRQRTTITENEYTLLMMLNP